MGSRTEPMKGGPGAGLAAGDAASFVTDDATGEPAGGSFVGAEAEGEMIGATGRVGVVGSAAEGAVATGSGVRGPQAVATVTNTPRSRRIRHVSNVRTLPY